MSKHTPGPWEVNYRRVTPVNGKQDGTDDICHVYRDNMANARLIVAAPDLLEACKEMELFCRVHGLDHPIIAGVAETARAAIAKAKGGSK